VLRMQGQLGQEFDAFLKSLSSAAPVSIRKHPQKQGIPWLEDNTDRSVPWCSDGIILKSRPVFTLDPLFHAGCYYVQEPSSMFAGEAFRQLVPKDQSIRVLDCCAAPGGKSTHLASMLNDQSLLVSNEVIRTRIPLLTANLDKWGCANTAVTSADPSAFSNMPSFFEVILVDAPCSGEGLFRKDPAASTEWSTANAQLCTVRQDRILEAVWPSLKPGGLLLYSTCTWNPEEDERTIARFSRRHGAESVPVEIRPEWGIEEVFHDGITGYRFYPHRLDGEGFFLAAIRKQDGDGPCRPSKKTAKKVNRSEQESVGFVLREPGRFQLREKSGIIHADPEVLSEDLQHLSSVIPLIRSGISIGTSRHGKLIPEHTLAMALDLSPEAFPVVDLDEADALTFLRRDTLNLPGKGIHLVRHRSHGLGWVNILPGRVNNLLPVNWRIRM